MSRFSRFFVFRAKMYGSFGFRKEEGKKRRGEKIRRKLSFFLFGMKKKSKGKEKFNGVHFNIFFFTI